MESPPPLSPPPLFPAAGPPPKKGLSGCAIAAIVGGVLLFLAAILVALAVPTFRKIQEMAEQKKAEIRAKVVQVPLTETEKADAAAFAQKLLLAVEAREGVHDFVDYETMADAVYSGFSGEQQFKAGFVRGVTKNPGGIFSDVLGQPGRFVRHWTREGVPAVTLRFEMAGGGVTYLDALLARQKTGGFKIVDAYNYLFGVMVSREVRSATALASGSGEGVLNQILGGAARKQDLDKLLQLVQANREGRAKEALAMYHALSPAMKTQSLAYIQYIKALQALGEESEEEYVQALEKARGILGGDVTVDLLLVDRHFLRQDFKAARRAIEGSLQAIGDDSYLYHLLGLACLHDKDVPAARDALKRATAVEPDLVDLVDLKLMILAAEKDHAGLVAAIKAFEARTGALVTPELLEDPVYDEFKKSPEFTEWSAAVRKKAP